MWPQRPKQLLDIRSLFGFSASEKAEMTHYKERVCVCVCSVFVSSEIIKMMRENKTGLFKSEMPVIQITESGFALQSSALVRL